ncbi:MAG: histidine kinase dimerization/phospho-acceptor domain-containing protein, partial [Bacteroidales bacterium]
MKEEKAIKLNSLIILSALIFAVILILLKLYLFAGIMIIVAAALGIIVIKSAVKILKVLSEKFKEAAESSGIKDDVITDFSHRIREPLNNLVVIGELLIKSELQKKQMELIETLIASTQNMVDTVNELTMQSAVSVSYKER